MGLLSFVILLARRRGDVWNFCAAPFRLADPQAILRQLQLEDHYDKMKPDKKQAFDQAHAHDLDPIDEVKVYIKNWRDDGVDPAVPRQAVLRLPNGTLVEPIETNEVKYDSGACGKH